MFFVQVNYDFIYFTALWLATILFPSSNQKNKFIVDI